MIDLCEQPEAALLVLAARDGMALLEAGLTLAEAEALREVRRVN